MGFPSASRCPQMPEPTVVVLDCVVGVPPAQLHAGTVVLVVVLVALVVVVESGIVIVGVIDVLVVVVVVVVELVVEVVVVVVTVVVVVGTVEVVVVTVVVVVGTVVVVVVVAPAHESAAHFPGPMLTPPWAAHLFAERIAHTLPWQQRTCDCAASARGTGPASTGTIADMKMKPRTLHLVIACIIGVLPAPRSGGIRDRRFVAPRLLSALLATSARSATGGSANRRSAPEVRLAIPSAWEA